VTLIKRWFGTKRAGVRPVIQAKRMDVRSPAESDRQKTTTDLCSRQSAIDVEFVLPGTERLAARLHSGREG
jgi:hypothetical protein